MSTQGDTPVLTGQYRHVETFGRRRPCMKMHRYGTYSRDDEMNEMESAHYHEIKPGYHGYPHEKLAFLGDSAPQTLTYCGDLSLLENRTVMICGARNASETGIDMAYRCGRISAECGFTVLSGYARGIDLAAHRGALEAGGKTIAFLPYGLSKFRVHKDIVDSFDPGSFLVLSELPVWQNFTIQAALRRNKLMVALADAVVAVEPGETGGTWYSAEKSGKMGKPLYFLEANRPEIIPRMESLGGKRIDQINGVPVLYPVFNEFSS
jgi:predicted Rossmann fold nucleotide-binding protein DprA/Smf involved in DNA uptake